MKKVTLIFVLAAMAAIVVLTTRCNRSHSVVGKTFTDTVISPVEIPSVVPGFSFPQDSATVYSWLAPNYDSTKVYNHAWGIWAGLTAFSGETFQGDSLPVYQTWLGIDDIKAQIQGKNSALEGRGKGSHRALFNLPKQIKDAVANGKQSNLVAVDDTNPGFWVAVSYNPPAANYAINNSILKQSVLNKYFVKGGIGAIPQFPDSAITIKPVYFVGQQTDSLIRIPVWPGPPTTPQTFGSSSWNTYVYANVNNSLKPGKPLVPVTGTNPSPAQIAAATCNLSDFINFKLDTMMAAYINKQQGLKAKTGDLALLVAMHVTTKEIHNWTWQSFYWAPNPGTPFSPSSALAAGLKPAQLKGAAAHYALTTAYTEVLPNQPINGGTNSGVTAMIGYNPYLEAGFGPGTFKKFPNKLNSQYVYGIQTNCMSCHALAAVGYFSTVPPYATAQYISMNDPVFINKVQVDFAWSIQGNVIHDAIPKAEEKK